MAGLRESGQHLHQLNKFNKVSQRDQKNRRFALVFRPLLAVLAGFKGIMKLYKYIPERKLGSGLTFDM